MSNKNIFKMIIGILGILFAGYHFFIVFTSISEGIDWFKVLGGMIFLTLGIFNIYQAFKRNKK